MRLWGRCLLCDSFKAKVMEAWKFKSMFFLSTSSIILKLTRVYVNAPDGPVTKADAVSLLVDFDLSENMLLLASCFALCGFMMALDDSGQHSARTLTIYYGAWCILVSFAVVFMVGGIGLPFLTKIERPYCWFLAGVVGGIFLPVIISAGQVFMQVIVSMWQALLRLLRPAPSDIGIIGISMLPVSATDSCKPATPATTPDDDDGNGFANDPTGQEYV